MYEAKQQTTSRQQTVKSIFHLTAAAPDSKCPADSSGTSCDGQPEIGISPVSGRHQWRHGPSVGWHRRPVSPSHVTMRDKSVTCPSVIGPPVWSLGSRQPLTHRLCREYQDSMTHAHMHWNPSSIVQNYFARRQSSNVLCSCLCAFVDGGRKSQVCKSYAILILINVQKEAYLLIELNRKLIVSIKYLCVKCQACQQPSNLTNIIYQMCSHVKNIDWIHLPFTHSDEFQKV